MAGLQLDDEPDRRPWYRQFWPWFLMLPPLAAVVGGFATLILAGGPPAMVVDDYGEIAMATRLDAARDRAAAERGLSAEISLVPAGAGHGVSLVLRQQRDGRWPSQVILRLTHPTIEDLDQQVVLTGAAGRYSGAVSRPPGRLYVEISDPEATWRLAGELAASSERLLLSAQEAS